MNDYVLTRAAQADLDEIWDYTEDTWSTEQAERYIRMLRDACADVGTRRKIGRNASTFRSGYLQLAVGSHFIFYTISSEGMVQIMRILHQQMDIASRLRKK